MSRISPVPYSFARRHGATIVALEAEQARVACREGVDRQVLQELRRLAARPLQLQSYSDSDYEQLISQLYQSGDSDIAAAADAGLEEELSLDQLAAQLPEPDDLLEQSDDAPIIRLINGLLAEGLKRGASDIHIEPFESSLLVRLRIDGVLHEVLRPPRALAPLLASRIKVMARLDIAEKRLPQDGRIALRIGGRPVDVRVSTLPGGHGERVVMRLLDKSAGAFDLAELGMDEHTLAQMRRLLARPHGILLVTGPTGAGKSTTLYAALQSMDRQARNILTVEDPIEYEIEGIGQTQVNTAIDMTFARGLRAILRQDPDVVMVGEIRDVETAQIAVQASLTGHLVLSTLHTNSAVGAITRLRDMGVESFLLASSLIGVCSQRLVRRLKPEGRQTMTATGEDAAACGQPNEAGASIHTANPELGEAAYRGRTGLYEVLDIDAEIRELIHNGATEQAILKASRAKRTPLAEDGWRKCREGITSLEEVLRVTRE